MMAGFEFSPVSKKEKYMDMPVIAQKAPYKEQLKAGRIYWWCACGLSSKQPFCDGSHKGSGISPVKVEIPEAKEVYFCGCKNTKDSPYCDGTHKQLL